MYTLQYYTRYIKILNCIDHVLHNGISPHPHAKKKEKEKTKVVDIGTGF